MSGEACGGRHQYELQQGEANANGIKSEDPAQHKFPKTIKSEAMDELFYHPRSVQDQRAEQP
jgi:hypothetical protein